MNFMRISSAAFVGGQISGAFFRPASINVNCPTCGRAANFGFGTAAIDTSRYVITHAKICSACEATIKFVGNYSQASVINDTWELTLFMLVEEKKLLNEIDFSGDISDGLRRSYLGAVQSFNNTNYAAATVMGRRTLEGLFKNLLDADCGDLALYKLIKKVASTYDFQEPIRRLADAIRNGGNLGAHFDLDREPDEETARMVVELLQYLIEYLYKLPRQIEELEGRLQPVDREP